MTSPAIAHAQVIYTAEEVADLLRLNKVTIYRYIREGRLRATRTGNRNYRVTAADIDRFLSENSTVNDQEEDQ